RKSADVFRVCLMVMKLGAAPSSKPASGTSLSVILRQIAPTKFVPGLSGSINSSPGHRAWHTPWRPYGFLYSSCFGPQHIDGPGTLSERGEGLLQSSGTTGSGFQVHHSHKRRYWRGDHRR